MRDVENPNCRMTSDKNELKMKRKELKRKLLNGDSVLFEDESNKIKEERHRLTQELSSDIKKREGATIDYNECYDILFNQIKIVIDGDTVPFHRQGESITLLDLNDKYDFGLSQVCSFIAGTIHIVLCFYSNWPRFALNDNSFLIEPPDSNTYESVLSDMFGGRSWGDEIKLMIGDTIINTKDLGRYLLSNSTISIKGWNISFYFLIRHIRECLLVSGRLVIPNSSGDFGGWRWSYSEE